MARACEVKGPGQFRDNQAIHTSMHIYTITIYVRARTHTLMILQLGNT